MPDDNVIRFTPGPKKRPAGRQPAPPRPQPPGKPSLPVAIVVGVVVVAIVLAINWWFGR